MEVTMTTWEKVGVIILGICAVLVISTGCGFLVGLISLLK